MRGRNALLVAALQLSVAGALGHGTSPASSTGTAATSSISPPVQFTKAGACLTALRNDERSGLAMRPCDAENTMAAWFDSVPDILGNVQISLVASEMGTKRVSRPTAR